MNQIAHPQATFNPFNRNRAILFSAVAVALAFLSFHGALDDSAFSKLDDLTKQSIALLAVSRGINGIVSVLKSIEFGAIVSSVQIGQVLDPIDDAAERLSVALMWAIGSLFLQDILLKIASGWMLKWAFLVITVLTAGTLLLAQSERLRAAVVATFGVSHVALAQFQGLLIKAFVVATIFRFIVPTFAVASFLVSQALVAPEIEKHKGDLEKSTKIVESISGPLSDPADPEAEVQILNEQGARLEGELKSLLADEERLTNLISKREESDWSDWIPFSGDNSDEELAEANARVKDTESEINQKESELECVERLLAGEHCDSLDEDDVPVLDTPLKERKEELESGLPPLREELASLQGEQTRLAELVKYEEERGQIESKIEETKELIDGNESALECAERRVIGENCISFIDRIKMMTRGVLDRFTEIVGAAQDMVERMASILILVVIENIVLPIIFLAIALKGSVPIARGVMRVSTSMREDTREALATLDQALPGRTN